jgi:pimeloyl-ACP methyl ester carboxylesterase
MSAHYLDNQQHPFKYFVAVGMPDLAVKYLGKIRIPILDLYGVDDIEPVLKSVKERAQAAKENIHYTQMVMCPNTGYRGKNNHCKCSANCCMH